MDQAPQSNYALGTQWISEVLHVQYCIRSNNFLLHDIRYGEQCRLEKRDGAMIKARLIQKWIMIFVRTSQKMNATSFQNISGKGGIDCGREKKYVWDELFYNFKVLGTHLWFVVSR